MRAELKNIYSYDVELKNYQGDEDGCIGVELVLDIGVSGLQESDTFNVFVCSPDYFHKYATKPRFIFNTILVDEFDLKKIKQLIENYLMYCSGTSWNEINQKMSKVFSREYDN